MTVQCSILKQTDMETCEKDLCETTKKPGKTGEAAQEEQEYTEALHGVIMLRKGKMEEREDTFQYRIQSLQIGSLGRI